MKLHWTNGHRRAGFTLVEVAIAGTIMVILFVSVAMVQGTSLDLMANTSSSGYLDEKAVRAVEAIASEMRWAESDGVLLTEENGADRVDFQTPTDYVDGAPVWSSTITYRIELSAVDANQNDVQDDLQFVRIQDGATRILCHYVEPGGLEITRTQDNLQVTIRLSKTSDGSSQVLSTNAQTSVSLRN